VGGRRRRQQRRRPWGVGMGARSCSVDCVVVCAAFDLEAWSKAVFALLYDVDGLASVGVAPRNWALFARELGCHHLSP